LTFYSLSPVCNNGHRFLQPRRQEDHQAQVDRRSGDAGLLPPVAGGGDADVDRRAAMYISRVQERLRRERAASEEYWRNRY
jgi:hypothetical protein